MKKKLSLIIFAFVLLSLVALAGCKPYTYEPSDQFFNISISFGGGDGATSRTFCFMTASSISFCEVQLDPAEDEQTQPEFNKKDNVFYPAESMPYTLDSTRSLHTVFVNNLIPDTKYFYRVGCPDNDLWSEWGSFTTDDGDGSFSFLHITDSQANTDLEFETFGNTLDKAFETVSDIEFILSTGDQVEAGPDMGMWDKFYLSIEDNLMNTTFSAAVGNHESLAMMINAHFYVKDINFVYHYAFEYGNCLFIILDTNSFNMQYQMDWMTSVINESDAKWRIVAQHKALFSSGTHADDNDILSLKGQLVPFFEEKSIDLVLAGHDHVYARTNPIDGSGNLETSGSAVHSTVSGAPKSVYTAPGGPIYVINRCVGTKFYNKSNTLNDSLIEVGDDEKIEKPVFSEVRIEDNKLTYISYEYDNITTNEVRIIDYFEINKD
jgi:3',5'-cyclic AMP phosphodiesterase CpdA